MDLNSVAIFSQVVDCGSFTQASDVLDMTKSTVSRKVAELEEHLGCAFDHAFDPQFDLDT